MENKKRIGFISLGCPKALVDSERILTRLRAEGYETASSYESADLVVVNTCGFIDDAVQESIETIQEALNENGKVIVTGCLGAKKKGNRTFVKKIFPDVLAVTGPNAPDTVLKAIHRYLPRPHDPFIDLLPPQGIKLTPKHYAYLKISEGCNHNCTFCIIPSFRGKLVSSPIGSLLDEAKCLFDTGTKELIVVSQDTGAYGTDTKFKTAFWQGRPLKTHPVDLAKALGEMAKSYGAWVRLHYLYPYPHMDQLVELMADKLIVPYIDVPLQHANPETLRRMKRPASGEKHLERILKWRKICPDLTIRSTFIVGFPGETQKEFQDLLDFVKDAQIERLGCFSYSPVEGAPANSLKNPVDEETREKRRQELMLLQEKISEQKLAQKMGSTQKIIIDQVVRGGAIGRSMADAPEIDGLVFAKKQKGDRQKLKVGDFINVKITEHDAHDLWALIERKKND